VSEPSVAFDVLQASEQLSGLVSPQTLIRQHEPLAKRTTLRVGGPADVYIEPANEADLANALRFCTRHQLPVFVLGRGSNLLVRDRGFRGVVICLAQPAFAQIRASGQDMRCGAGARLKAVAMEAKKCGIGGFEFLEGIPGSVGGGLRMNAGAMGGAIFDLVISVRVMDFSGQVQELEPSKMSVAYRGCSTLKSEIGLEALLRGQTAPRDQIEARLGEFSRRRWSSQPAAPSAGCMFKNPATIPAGKLIDELGLKGTRVGGAAVSLEHGNFLVNDGTATARDVLDLIELVRSRARATRGIELETEVEIIGE
jgi:UDP-N-acetylenolpyruvoylglucosamine reductase